MSQVEIIPQPSVRKTSLAPGFEKKLESRELELGDGASLTIDADAEGHAALVRKLDKVRKKRASLERRPLKKRLTAKLADKHELYQLSVQSPEEDIAFLRKVYKGYRKKKAKHFREDFCGTALLASTWVDTKSGCTAEGYDIDPDPVAWGLHQNVRLLGEDASKVHLVLGDVRERSRKAPDVRCAQNFSYWCFTERADMVAYFRSVYEDLADDGVFVCDLHGGSETQEEMEEERDIHAGFTYVWDQYRYWPIQSAVQNHIHFRFGDGTELFRAFTYDWRLWSLTEIRDCLHDAGFKQVDAYWEGTASDGESGNGKFTLAKRGEADLSWIAYLAGVK